jgi:beta-lactamase regulating signal transducer with metallopeptidase domain
MGRRRSAMPTAAELLSYTLTCSLAALAVLLFKTAFRHRLDARIHVLLWGLLLLRLVVPVFPTSPVSVYNLVAPVQESLLGFGEQVLSNQIVLPVAQPSVLPVSPAPTVGTLSSLTLGNLAVWVWAVGAASVLLWFVLVYVRTRSRLRHAPDLVDDRLLAVLEESRQRVGIRRISIRVVELASARAPYISGVFRPVLVLPSGAACLPEETLRQILVHELVHRKRGDVWTGWLTLAFTALHWFNPFLWYVFRVVRQDIEIACDERVIRILGEERRVDYGRTILSFAAPHVGWVPGSTALASGSDDLSRRIGFLAFFRKPKGILAAIAVVLTLALGVLLLTDALPVGVLLAKSHFSQRDIVSLLKQGGIPLSEPMKLPVGAKEKTYAGVAGVYFTLPIPDVGNSLVTLFVCDSSSQREQVSQELRDFEATAIFAYRAMTYQGKNVLLHVSIENDPDIWFERIAKAMNPAGITSPRYPAATDPTSESFTLWDVANLFSQGGLPISRLADPSNAQVLLGITSVMFEVPKISHSRIQLFVCESPAQRAEVSQTWRELERFASYAVPSVTFEGKNVFVVAFDMDASTDWFDKVDPVLVPAGIARTYPKT